MNIYAKQKELCKRKKDLVRTTRIILSTWNAICTSKNYKKRIELKKNKKKEEGQQKEVTRLEMREGVIIFYFVFHYAVSGNSCLERVEKNLPHQAVPPLFLPLTHVIYKNDHH